MNKKAQSQIITTVLIILLVLAAIVIVWQVVKGTVEGGSEEITSTTACIGVTIDPVSVSGVGTSTAAVNLQRTSGGTTDKIGWVVLVNGLTNVTSPADNSQDLGQLESTSVTIANLNATDNLEIAGKLGDSACGSTSDASVSDID